ncbi:hypothetical protein F0562_025045 [Nyssa sinensis]|uniref:Uncharacterized protein n=1 Tax=Nyssa sinensis TaxID=561372 RepID=A0A5J5BGV8_9ASTE|nr:hypothetical protein F0562_025045 [Nyssa sinensis]
MWVRSDYNVAGLHLVIPATPYNFSPGKRSNLGRVSDWFDSNWKESLRRQKKKIEVFDTFLSGIVFNFGSWRFLQLKGKANRFESVTGWLDQML